MCFGDLFDGIVGWYSAGVTGNALPADIALFKSSGVDQVLLKPLNKDLFKQELLSFIDRRGK